MRRTRPLPNRRAPARHRISSSLASLYCSRNPASSSRSAAWQAALAARNRSVGVMQRIFSNTSLSIALLQSSDCGRYNDIPCNPSQADTSSMWKTSPLLTNGPPDRWWNDQHGPSEPPSPRRFLPRKTRLNGRRVSHVSREKRDRWVFLGGLFRLYPEIALPLPIRRPLAPTKGIVVRRATKQVDFGPTSPFVNSSDSPEHPRLTRLCPYRG